MSSCRDSFKVLVDQSNAQRVPPRFDWYVMRIVCGGYSNDSNASLVYVRVSDKVTQNVLHLLIQNC